jgi:uncharacterized protein (DUF2249 family)
VKPAAHCPPPAAGEVLDVRALPCAGKHPLIFRRWAQLGIGRSFVLVNDHRPEPLRQQFERLVPDCCDWCEIPPPPGAFAVRLTRLRPDPAGFDPQQAAGCGGPSDAAEPDVLLRLQLDYRALPAPAVREILRHLAPGLADAVALDVDVPAPDPDLDDVLTALGLTFRGAALSGAAGWRYSIRRPVAPVA